MAHSNCSMRPSSSRTCRIVSMANSYSVGSRLNISALRGNYRVTILLGLSGFLSLPESASFAAVIPETLLTLNSRS